MTSAKEDDRFRPDIDGLRAVAILVVVAFHTGISSVAGGFVGVDVFFVISGFLITRNLLNERTERGSIDLRAFWGRRLRRLAPAAAVAIVATLLAVRLILPPLDWQRTAPFGLASAFYVANIAFARNASNYFADQSSPFLHMWSLSLEEQFYLVWPVLMLALTALAAKLGGRRLALVRIVLGVVSVGSFGLSLLLTRRGTPWAFYGLPTRAWQFSAAGLLATVALSANSTGPATTMRTTTLRARAVLGWAGLAAIGASVAVFDGRTPYPGMAALLPTLGALLVIASGPTVRGGPGSMLSWAPLRWVGRLSYSWYLWHWPAIVLTAAALETSSTLPLVLAAVGSAVPAYLSLRFVENPVRFSPRLAGSWRRSVTVGVALVLIAGAAAVALRLDATRALRDPFQRRVVAADADRDFNRPCRWDGPTCTVGAPDAAVTIAVVGDSHAQALTPAFAAAVEELDGVRVVVRSYGACPAYDVRVARDDTGTQAQGCVRYRQETARELDRFHPQVVIAVNASYDGRLLGSDGRSDAERWDTAMRTWVSEQRARDRTVAVVLDGPAWEINPIRCLGRHGSVRRCEISRSTGAAPGSVDRTISARVAGELEIPTFSMLDQLCPDDRCRLEVGSTLTMMDTNHVSATYSSRLGVPVAAWLRSILAAT